MSYEFDMSKWSTVIVKPSLWWRIKALFGVEIIFCWGQDRYMTKGFLGETLFSIGGVPTHMRDRASHGGCYRGDGGDSPRS